MEKDRNVGRASLLGLTGVCAALALSGCMSGLSQSIAFPLNAANDRPLMVEAAREVRVAAIRGSGNSPTEPQVPWNNTTTTTGQSNPTDAAPVASAGSILDQTVELSDQHQEVKPTINLRGRIQADAIFINQSPKDKAIIGDEQNVTGFRRARLGAEGTVGEQVNWVAEFDFANGAISFKDVFVGIDELPIIRRIRVGHMSEPFSLESLTTSNDLPFLERSNIDSLDPDRNWGVGIFSYSENERATLQVAAFRSGTSGNSGNDIGDNNDMAYDVRATCLPWYDEASDGRYLFHLGAAFSQRYPKNQTVSYNQGPQSGLLTTSDNPGSPFVPTITIPASENQLYNVDWALVLGALSFQGEWSATYVHQIGGGPVFLHGFYVFASYFLTGENRQYLAKDGVFGTTRVRSPFLCMKRKQFLACGPGAWELTARFAYADFANSNIPPSNGLKVGDREAELTCGVNWYLNDHARLMFNYVHVVPVDPNFGPSYADGFGIRTALFW
jgi:phosphate-selective porin OprO and OprP